MENKPNESTGAHIVKVENKRRRSLLPWWIKTFTWVFLIFGAIAPLGFIAAILGIQFQLALYGLETFYPLSLLGLLLIGIFLFKGITAFGLWNEKDWAISCGQIDAILGIIICVFVMVIYPFVDNRPGFHISFRLELLILIPFLLRLDKIKDDWRELAVANNN